jgi:hypothetical protein
LEVVACGLNKASFIYAIGIYLSCHTFAQASEKIKMNGLVQKLPILPFLVF